MAEQQAAPPQRCWLILGWRHLLACLAANSSAYLTHLVMKYWPLTAEKTCTPYTLSLKEPSKA